MGKKMGLKKRIFILSCFLLVMINIVAIFHARKFTHFTDTKIERTTSPTELNNFDKIKTIIFGVNNPRPENEIQPKGAFETVIIKGKKSIEAWHIKQDSAKGTVIICHGYSGSKSKMLTQSTTFNNLGYNTLVIDFMGSGGSEGNQTTIGFYEAEQVKNAFNYIQKQGEKNIILYGTSMGSAAIMKMEADNQLHPNSIIIECPFGTMQETVNARFKIMHIPSFPMAYLLMFWGGIQNNFNAFEHNPTEYAKKITCPTLLLYGALDEKVSQKEIEEIFKNLNGKKTLKIYENIAHENYLTKNQAEWTKDISKFISSIPKTPN
jgi:hypothetical protein